MFKIRVYDTYSQMHKDHTADTVDEVLEVVMPYKKQDIYITIDTDTDAGRSFWSMGCGNQLESIVRQQCERLIKK